MARIHLGHIFHLAGAPLLTEAGGARALDIEDRFGNFDVPKEADFVVVDPNRTPGRTCRGRRLAD